jgi:hypothetical protein
MAKTIDTAELRTRLKTPEGVSQDPFGLLGSISTLLHSANNESVGREMVLRALEWREAFGIFEEVLDSLARSAGLYPFSEYNNLDLSSSIAYEFHRPANVEDHIVFHREQAAVYRRLVAGDNIILSAPTSFGKSRIIDAMIATRRYTNVAIVVPTLALIDETRRRMAKFSADFKIITHITQPPAKKNIFVLTAERVVAYKQLPRIDFFAVDEFYKIGAMEEDESRTIALNEAFYRLLKGGGQFYLLGPNIKRIPEGLEKEYRCFFFPTSFTTVVVETQKAPGTGKNIERLISVLRDLDEPTLVFCSSPPKVNEVARAMIENGIGMPSPSLRGASNWIASTFHPDWIMAAGLTHGIGIHHGRLPRSLSQFVVRAFNEGKIRFLVCTSTLIEGVNTRAKNVLIWDNTISRRPIDFFTYNNIRGRSGRMFEHFTGRVFLFNSPPQEELPFVDFPIFTQDETTPEALLIQMQDTDLTKKSKDRMKKYTVQNVLAMETLRNNKGINPDSQIRLAEYIEANAKEIWSQLAWKAYPTYEELKFASELIWEYFVDGNQRNGVFSGSQLALKIHRLSQTASTATRVLDELKPGKYVAKSPDDAVERVLQFERNWAGFDFPKLLMALSTIQKDVLDRLKHPSGDYAQYAAQVESLFRPPIVSALDEYGIPFQVADKMRTFLGTNEDLDVALGNLKTLDLTNVRLTPFESELVRDAQSAL